MRIGIVNDMKLACEALRRVIQSAPGHHVAWTASDGAEAVDRVRDDRPDLVLMDLIMPGVDGAEATRRIMADHPCPILVVTSSVSGNIGKVYEAMGHGAVDAVDTPVVLAGGRMVGSDQLLRKIDTIDWLVNAHRVPRVADDGAPRPTREAGSAPCTLVVLGASTGGPKALSELLAGLRPGLPACLVIAQHVDASFAPGLASWLGERSRLPVELIVPGRSITPGCVLLASTGDHLVMGPDRRLRYTPEPAAHFFRPSVDVFFSSVSAHWPEPGVAVLLTGIGRDGAEGLRMLGRNGWLTIAQDEPSSAVWGMPRAAVELGAAARVLPPEEIARALVSHIGNKPAHPR